MRSTTSRLAAGGLAHYRKAKRAQTDTDFETWTEDTVTNTLNAFDTGDVRATDVVIGFSHTAGIDQQASESVFPTVKAGHDTMPSVHTATVRRLTPLECERLQGFPDNWTAERFDFKKQAVVPQADSARYKQMGNAVAVPVFDWVIGRLVAAHANALPASEAVA